MIYRPIYVDKIMAYVDAPFIKILTGVRRCGKSTILKMIIEELKKRGVPDDRIISYRFDSMEYMDMTAKVTRFYKTYFFNHLSPSYCLYHGVKTLALQAKP